MNSIILRRSVVRGSRRTHDTHFSLQFLTFIFFKSSSTSSSHLNLGLPTALDEHCSHSVNFLTVLVVSILITCAAQRNLHCDFINLTTFCLIRFPNYSFIDSLTDSKLVQTL